MKKTKRKAPAKRKSNGKRKPMSAAARRAFALRMAKARAAKKRGTAPKRKAAAKPNPKKRKPTKRKNASKRRAPLSLARRRRNSEDGLEAAQDLYERFHGKKSEKTTTFEETDHYSENVAQLGKLISFQVYIGSDRKQTTLDGFGNCQVVSTPDGGQLYFIGGDQALDIGALGLADQMPKDHLEIGECAYITYHTKKGFHEFAPINYFHKFGEDGGTPPTLNYDTRNRRVYLTGGTYQVHPEGITN